MWKDVVTLVVGLNAIGGVIGYTIKRIKGDRQRRHDADHDEYMRRLRRENEELDQEINRIGRQ